MMNWIHIYYRLILFLAVGGIQAQDDWELVFRAVEGIGDDPYALWIDDNMVLNEDEPDARKLTDEFKGHYKSLGAVYWQLGLLQVTEIKVSLYKSGVAVKELEFDGRGSNTRNFFDISRLETSPWTDLPMTSSFFGFSVDGHVDANVERRFMIHAALGTAGNGCENDVGWMAVIANRPGAYCFWDLPRSGSDFPFFIYSNKDTYVKWQDGNGAAVSSMVAYADVFAIFVKHTNRATMLSCVTSCTVDESAGVIYIQVIVDLNFSPVSRRRRSYDYTYTGVMADAVKRSKREGIFFKSAVLKTLKTATDSADAIKDYGPIFFDTEESLTIPIEIVDDDLVEGDETFTVEITPLISVGDLSSTETYSVVVTILDNDVTPPPVVPTPVFSIDKFMYPVKESVGSVVVKVKRHVDTSRKQDIVFSTSDVNAISPTDYEGQPTGVILSFQPGDDEKTHSFVIEDDNIVEGTEYFEMMLHDPDIGDLGTPHAATATITDDDYTHVLASNYFCVREADETIRIPIIRKGFLGQISSVNLRTSDSTASSNQPGNDFNSVDTAVEFAVDSSVTYVDINIVKDGVFEDNEQFTVELHSNGQEKEISEPSTAIVLIKSDDLLCDPPCQNGGSCSGLNICTCPTGFSGDVCETALRVISGSLTITESNGFGLVYSSALANPQSAEYKALENTVITQLTGMFSASVSGFNKVIVVAFSEGSVIVEYNVLLDSSSSATANTIVDVVHATVNNAGLLGDSSLKLDPATFIATAECPFEYCLNRGICSVSGGRYYCACPDSVTGDRCEVPQTDAVPVLNPAPTDPPKKQQLNDNSSGLSEGNVAIIAAAVFMTVLVALIFLACYCWNYQRATLCSRSKQPDPPAASAYYYDNNNAGYFVDGSMQNPYSLQNPQSIGY